MAITNIRKVRIRYVRVPPEDAERRRRALLDLQVRSILKASHAAHAEASHPNPALSEEDA